MKNTLMVAILLTGLLLTACGSQITEAPASQPTEEPAPATQAPTDPPPPTNTVEPTVEPTPTEEPMPSEVSFAGNVLPLIRSRCQNCHGGSQGIEEGLELTSYETIMAGSDNGPVIIAGDADASLLVELVVKNEMPKRGPKLTPPQIQLIIDWINQGALDN